MTQMFACSEIADYVWLTGEAAGALLEQLAADQAPLHRSIERLRGSISPERARLVAEQVELRRRAAAKFSQAQRIFFTRLGLEQATDEWVAAYKAKRLTAIQAEQAGASPPPIADLCCGIGGDLISLAARGPVLAVERSTIVAHFAAVNSGSAVEVADVVDFHLAEAAAWHIDPDRRPTGRRTTSIEHCEPRLATIERLLSANENAAVKLAPATRVPDRWKERCELEWISRDRECRQLVAWHGELAGTPGQHRATVVTGEHQTAVRTISGPPNRPVPIAPRADRYVFDVDPAVLAAHLKGALAAECGLATLGPGPTYLTGPHPIADAALSCFEVADVLPFDKRGLARHLREQGVGQLEIKKRGVEVNPEALRRELKLRGDRAATLLITPIAGRPAAILAQRV